MSILNPQVKIQTMSLRHVLVAFIVQQLVLWVVLLLVNLGTLLICEYLFHIARDVIVVDDPLVPMLLVMSLLLGLAAGRTRIRGIAQWAWVLPVCGLLFLLINCLLSSGWVTTREEFFHPSLGYRFGPFFSTIPALQVTCYSLGAWSSGRSSRFAHPGRAHRYRSGEASQREFGGRPGAS